jgi:hypothetical protein
MVFELALLIRLKVDDDLPIDRFIVSSKTLASRFSTIERIVQFQGNADVRVPA